MSAVLKSTVVDYVLINCEVLSSTGTKCTGVNSCMVHHIAEDVGC